MQVLNFAKKRVITRSTCLRLMLTFKSMCIASMRPHTFSYVYASIVILQMRHFILSEEEKVKDKAICVRVFYLLFVTHFVVISTNVSLLFVIKLE